MSRCVQTFDWYCIYISIQIHSPNGNTAPSLWAVAERGVSMEFILSVSIFLSLSVLSLSVPCLLIWMLWRIRRDEGHWVQVCVFQWRCLGRICRVAGVPVYLLADKRASVILYDCALLPHRWSWSVPLCLCPPCWLLSLCLFVSIATGGSHHGVLCGSSGAGGSRRDVLQQLFPLPALPPGRGPGHCSQPVGAKRAPGLREAYGPTGPLIDTPTLTVNSLSGLGERGRTSQSGMEGEGGSVDEN